MDRVVFDILTNRLSAEVLIQPSLGGVVKKRRAVRKRYVH